MLRDSAGGGEGAQSGWLCVVVVVGGGDTLPRSTDGLVQTPLIYSQEEPRHQIMRK